MESRSPLSRHLVVATGSLEEARATFGKLVIPITVEQLDRTTSFHWRSHQIALGPISIAIQQYGAGFQATSESSPDLFSVSFPVTAVGSEATSGRVTQAIARGRSSFLHSPSGRTSFRLGTNYRGLQLYVRTNEIMAALGAMIGTTPREALRFEPRLSLAHGIGSSLERVVSFIASEANREGGLLASPLAASRFGEGVLASLLAGHAHNYSRRLERLDRAADPRSVRVTADYLEANATKAIRMVDLAQVSGVSVRALQLGFLKHRGCTPMEFLRERRLDRARARLMTDGEHASIAEIARACGFSHVGRFSARYRARFGELPAQTRSRRGA